MAWMPTNDFFCVHWYHPMTFFCICHRMTRICTNGFLCVYSCHLMTSRAFSGIVCPVPLGRHVAQEMPSLWDLIVCEPRYRRLKPTVNKAMSHLTPPRPPLSSVFFVFTIRFRIHRLHRFHRLKQHKKNPVNPVNILKSCQKNPLFLESTDYTDFHR